MIRCDPVKNTPVNTVVPPRIFVQFLLSMVLLAGFCGTVAAATEIANGTLTPGISTHTGIIWRSAQIDGDRIVWAEHISNDGFVYNIYLYNITTGKETLVSPSSSDTNPQDTYSMDEHPVAISANRVVWTEDMGIRAYDISTGKRSTLTGNSGDYGSHLVYQYPGISGDTVVWTERPAGTATHAPDIVAYNVTTGKKTIVSRGPWDKTSVRISGSRIVWEDFRKSGFDRDVLLYDLSTGQERVLCSAPGPQSDPKISGDYVVWSDRRDSNWDIYAYNLTTGTETVIADSMKEQDEADISGNLIVWRELPTMLFYNPYDESNRLVLYDLSTGKEFEVRKDVPVMLGTAISGNRIVYMDLANIPADQREVPRENPVHEISLFTLDPSGFPVTTPAAGMQTDPAGPPGSPEPVQPPPAPTRAPGFGLPCVFSVLFFGIVVHGCRGR